MEALPSFESTDLHRYLIDGPFITGIGHVIRTKRVLVIDDSSYNLFVFEELVRSLDPRIRVDTALNG